MVVAHGSVTISWNTHAAAPHAPAAVRAPGPLRTGVVRGVHGTHVILRLPDGTTHVYVASPDQARVLQRLIGTSIQFRLPPMSFMVK